VRDTDLATTFLTMPTVLADAATLSIAGAFVASRSRHDRAWTWLRGEVRASGVGLAWVVAAVTTRPVSPASLAAPASPAEAAATRADVPALQETAR
jgi:hypothetical protein